MTTYGIALNNHLYPSCYTTHKKAAIFYNVQNVIFKKGHIPSLDTPDFQY